VEAALEGFLNARSPDLTRQTADDMNARFGALERELRTIAETVALHARYHLSVMPPLPSSQQRAACILGDERFKVLAEQVDRRVRECRPLMQETIDGLHSSHPRGAKSNLDGDEPIALATAQNSALNPDAAEAEPESTAAAGEGGSSAHFHQRRHPGGGPT
jgi:hypothetical protein